MNGLRKIVITGLIAVASVVGFLNLADSFANHYLGTSVSLTGSAPDPIPGE